MAKRLLALLAFVALALSALHTPAMAVSAMSASAKSASATIAPVDMDCHASAGKTAEPQKPGKAPTCCPEGKCDSQCSPVAAFFSNAARSTLAVLRAALEAPALAAAPLAAPGGLDRPPRPRA